jgi:ABC-type nickel/cobalt efflux system permease component RcnA
MRNPNVGGETLRWVERTSFSLLLLGLLWLVARELRFHERQERAARDHVLERATHGGLDLLRGGAVEVLHHAAAQHAQAHVAHLHHAAAQHAQAHVAHRLVHPSDRVARFDANRTSRVLA